MAFLLVILLYTFFFGFENLPVDAWVVQSSPYCSSSTHQSSWHSIQFSSRQLTKLPTIHGHPARQYLVLRKIMHHKNSCFMMKNGSNSSSFTTDEQGDSTLAPGLLRLLSPVDSCNADRMSGTDLAYVGDVVYELFIRSRIVWPPKRTADLQEQAVALVRAEHQSKLLSKLKEEFSFTDKEKQILNRGRNAGSGRNNNRRNPAAYQDSTSFEAILGYMYISSPTRCEELLCWIQDNVDKV